MLLFLIMTIAGLDSRLWASIFAYLPMKERSRAACVCTLFKQILEGRANDAILWPAATLRKSTHIPSPYVKKAFERLVSASATPSQLSGTETEGSALLVHNALLIATSSGGEVKILHTQLANTPCTEAISRIAEKDLWSDVQYRLQGNWLIRSYQTILHDLVKNNHEVWELDAKEGRAKKIHTVRFRALGPSILEPVRHKNELYIADAWRSTVAVFSFQDQPIRLPTIPGTQAARQLRVVDETLVVGYADNSCLLKDLTGKRLVKETTIGAAPSCDLIGRFRAIHYDNNTVALSPMAIDQFTNEPAYFLSCTQEGLFFGDSFAMDGEWITFTAANEDETFYGILLFNLATAKEKHVTQAGYIPTDPDNTQLLRWPFYAYANNNQLSVFALWDLQHNEKNELIPTAIYSVPKECTISAFCLQNSRFVVSTTDGKIFRFG